MLRELKLKKTKNEGFTIIEVMIVLAIAGLIMLIVFLAVPALQRNGRNTQRKADVSSLLSAYATYQSNRNGEVPATCDANSSSCWMKEAKLGFYDTSVTGNATWTKLASTFAPDNVANAEKLRFYNNAKCLSGGGETTGTQATLTTTANGASSRSIVALYAVETASGAIYTCQEA